MTKPSRSGKIAGGSAAALAIALGIGIIKPWEGRELTPYRDIVGVLTVCDGITGPEVVDGKTYTPATCDELLTTTVAKKYEALDKCITPNLAPNQMAAVLSLGYNVGTGAVCKSTMVRLINEGQPAATWCREFSKWVFAGGRKIKGLVNRRAAEQKLCMEGIEAP